MTTEREDEVVARCKAASYDERLADGMLYCEAADTIAALKAKCTELQEQRGTLAATEKGFTPLGQMLSDMEQRAIAAEAKCVELERAAQRYRIIHNGGLPGYAIMVCHEDFRHLSLDGDVLDAAIDAALPQPSDIRERK